MTARELIRFEAGKTIAEAADAAGVSQRTIRRWEQDAGVPELSSTSAPAVRALADFLGVSVAQYLGVDANDPAAHPEAAA